MGYTLTRASIFRVKSYLDEMVAAKDDCMWATSDPRLAYHLREGIAATRKLELKEYAGLASKFKIKSSQGKVIAELRERSLEVEFAKATRRLTVRDVSTAIAIVGAAIKHNAPEMYFPDANLNKEELEKVEKWARAKGYSIVSHGEGGITLTKDTNHVSL